MYLPIIPWDEIRNLPLPDLAVKVLAKQAKGTSASLHSVLNGLKQAMAEDPQPDDNALLDRIADAWSWLESHALLATHANQHTPVQRLSERGRELAADPAAIAKVWSAERLAGPLDSALATARTTFALGDYETACFAALKAVEVEVRRVAGLPNQALGVDLMRKAFKPQDGVLTDAQAVGGEQQATADLFAGAIGVYKNPASHRTIQFEDPVEAAEVLQLADLLLRIVHRAEARLAQTNAATP
jgi:uncharacterized protein (TIGR02391 family)